MLELKQFIALNNDGKAKETSTDNWSAKRGGLLIEGLSTSRGRVNYRKGEHSDSHELGFFFQARATLMISISKEFGYGI